jgi:hypothetical protein
MKTTILKLTAILLIFAGTNLQTLDGTFYVTIFGPFYISDCNPKTYSIFTILNNIPWIWICSNLAQGWGTGKFGSSQ